MSDNDSRADLFDALQELSEIVPEMCAGQLVAAVGEVCIDIHGRGLGEASDAELLEAVWRFRRDFEAATVRATEQDDEHATLTYWGQAGELSRQNQTFAIHQHRR